MKFLFLLLVFLFISPSTVAYADNSTPHVVCTSDVWLLDEKGEKIFIIPASYYARINNLDDNFYYVTFNGVAGKIKKNEVSTVGYHKTAKGTALELYTNDEFSDFSHIQLKQHPDKGAECLLNIPFGDSYTYLGDYPTDGGEKWYFVKYNGVTGYLLASRTNEPDLTIEVFTPEVVEDEKPEEEDSTPSSGLEETEMKIIIIVGLIVPALAIVVLLFKPHRKKFD